MSGGEDPRLGLGCEFASVASSAVSSLSQGQVGAPRWRAPRLFAAHSAGLSASTRSGESYESASVCGRIAVRRERALCPLSRRTLTATSFAPGFLLGIVSFLSAWLSFRYWMVIEIGSRRCAHSEVHLISWREMSNLEIEESFSFFCQLRASAQATIVGRLRPSSSHFPVLVHWREHSDDISVARGERGLGSGDQKLQPVAEVFHHLATTCSRLRQSKPLRPSCSDGGRACPGESSQRAE